VVGFHICLFEQMLRMKVHVNAREIISGAYKLEIICNKISSGNCVNIGSITIVLMKCHYRCTNLNLDMDTFN